MKSVDCQRKELPGLKELSFNWIYGFGRSMFMHVV